MSAVPERRLADPAAPWWTMADIAARAGLAEVTIRRERLPEWERDQKLPFPRPLPWSKRQLRWHTQAVLRWFEMRETAAMAVPVRLSIVQGGRP